MTRRYEEIDVTPALAEKWLGSNVNNRNIRARVVNAYARDMREGRWRDTGEAIKFGRNDELYDGQHRLHAVIKADVTVRMLVVFGLSPESADAMDSGVRRTGSDQLKRRGHTYSPILAAVAKKLILWDDHGCRRTFNNVAVTNAEIVDYCEATPELLATVDLVTPYLRRVPAPNSVTVFSFILFARIDTGDAIEFLESLASGANLDVRDPALVLRNRLIEINQRTGVHIDQSRLIGFFILAWNAWRSGRKISILRLSGHESYPEPK